MPSTPQENVNTLLTGALTATQGESDAIKMAAITTATRTIPRPGAGTANLLWIILVCVLGGVVLASALAGVIYVLENKVAPPDILVTIFTTSISGLIGLFVRPPTNS
jgi:uncharacterized membrane protein YbhN (UPF0104 family)